MPVPTSFAATAPLLDLRRHTCSLEEQEEEDAGESRSPRLEHRIFTWGKNGQGQCLADGAAAIVPAPRLAAFRRPVRSLAAGWGQSLLIDGAGGLWGGGENHEKWLSEEAQGDDEEPPRQLPLRRLDLVEVDGVPFEAVQLGHDHALAVLEGGRAVISWGASNEFGQLGHGPSIAARVRPAVVPLSGVPVKQVACGEFHSLVLTVQGEVFSFGSNAHGALGLGKRGAEPLPQAERVVANHLRNMPVRGIAAGVHSSMAISIGGQVFCWGSNGRGRLGLGPSFDHEDAVLVPTVVPSSSLPGMARAVAAGGQHSAVILRRGRLFLAGDNRMGQLGQARKDVDWTSSFTELPFQDFSLRVRAVALGAAHTLILSYEGELYACGSNSEGQLGNSCASQAALETIPPADVPVKLSLRSELEDYIVIGIATCQDHNAVLALSLPDTHEKVGNGGGGSARLERDAAAAGTSASGDGPHAPLAGSSRAARRPQSSMSVLRFGKQAGLAGTASGDADCRGLLSQTIGADSAAKHFFPPAKEYDHSRAAPTSAASTTLGGLAGATAVPMFQRGGGSGLPGQARFRALGAPLSSGCTSRVGRGRRHLAIAMAPRRPARRPTGASGNAGGGAAATRYNDEEFVLLQPVVQPGVLSTVGFASLSVGKLSALVQRAATSTASNDASAISNGTKGANMTAEVAELLAAVSAALAIPSLLNASFIFPGLYRPRLDAEGLLGAFQQLATTRVLFEQLEAPLLAAAFEGLTAWANDHDEAASLVHRDQLRGVPALLLSPLVAKVEKAQPYELIARLMRLVAWMPPEGRRELQEVIVEDCCEEQVLLVLVSRVREHCDETVRRAHQLQRLSPEIWEGLMLLQLLWGANEAIAKRLDQSLHGRAGWADPSSSKSGRHTELGRSLTQTLSNFCPTGTSNTTAPATSLMERFSLAAPQILPPVPHSEFHLLSLAEEMVPPELEFRLFIENSGAGPISSSEVLELPLYAARTDYGYEYVLPSKMRSFMANRNLVPVSYTRKVLQVENNHAQVYLQQQVARRVAQDLEVLPGHEIHIDPALLFFILKVRRDHIREDTTAALERATPEDLRRQLKVVFEGEQGVDEGGLAREFFRLLSARVFTADCGLFDPAVAQSARVLWFDKGSTESTDFWLAGVILGLVVYNNMPGLNVRLPSVVFKKIKDEPLGLEDLRQVHPETYLSLRSLLEWEADAELSAAEANALFENTFCLDFTVNYKGRDGSTIVKELRSGGKEIPVTLDTRSEFVQLYCEWLLVSSVERQFEPFRKGVRRVCDSPLFNALDSAELELIVCGEQELDFTQLRRNAHYESFASDSPYIDDFWQVLFAMGTPQKKRFLSFVTGSDLAPVGGLQELQLVLQRNGGEPTERLPTAHTCFNLLLLPEYGSVAKLEHMLTMAMLNSEGFGLE